LMTENPMYPYNPKFDVWTVNVGAPASAVRLDAFFGARNLAMKP